MQQPSDRQPDLAMFSAILLEIYRWPAKNHWSAFITPCWNACAHS